MADTMKVTANKIVKAVIHPKVIHSACIVSYIQCIIHTDCVLIVSLFAGRIITNCFRGLCPLSVLYSHFLFDIFLLNLV